MSEICVALRSFDALTQDLVSIDEAVRIGLGGIESLIPRKDFFPQYWDRNYSKSKYIPVKTEIAESKDLAGTFSDKSTWGNYRGKIKCFSPGSSNEKKFIGIEEARDELVKLSTLYYLDLEHEIEAAQVAYTSISQQLGGVRGHVSAFISEKRSYMPFHWDNVHNFTVQISGKKAWYLAENEEFKNVSCNHAAGRKPESFFKSGAAILLEDVRPIRKNIKKVIMEPGDVLYLPRGYWHATRTLTQSLSVSFNFYPLLLVERLASLISSHSRVSDALRFDMALMQRRYNSDVLEKFSSTISDLIVNLVDGVDKAIDLLPAEGE
jgi:hypothetical protein